MNVNCADCGSKIQQDYATRTLFPCILNLICKASPLEFCEYQICGNFRPGIQQDKSTIWSLILSIINSLTVDRNPYLSRAQSVLFPCTAHLFWLWMHGTNMAMLYPHSQPRSHGSFMRNQFKLNKNWGYLFSQFVVGKIIFPCDFSFALSTYSLNQSQFVRY